MGLRVSRGCLVVALLVFVNVQLLILVLRSQNLLTQPEATSTAHFSLATIARGDNRQLRGDPPSASASSTAAAGDAEAAKKATRPDQGALFAAPDNLAALLGHSTSALGWSNPFSSSASGSLSSSLASPPLAQALLFPASSTDAYASVEREASGYVVPALRPVRPTGKWARQLAPLPGLSTPRAFELLDGERAALAEALGRGGANFSAQVSPRFARVPAWVWAGGASRLPKQARSRSGSSSGSSGSGSSGIGSGGGGGGEDDDRSAELLAGLGGGVPCLFSEATGRNVFLVAAATDEWAALQRGKVSGPLLAELLSGQRRCPRPTAGQLGPSAEASLLSRGWGGDGGGGGGGGRPPEVSFIIPMHDHVSITLECLLSLLRFADEVPSSVEYVLVDDGSLEDVDEIRVEKHTSTSAVCAEG